MENENMIYNEETMEPAIEAIEMAVADNSGVNVGKVLLTTGGVAVAVFAAVKLVQLGIKAWKKHNEAKETEQAGDHDFVVPSDAEIEVVTNK